MEQQRKTAEEFGQQRRHETGTDLILPLLAGVLDLIEWQRVACILMTRIGEAQDDEADEASAAVA